MARIKKRGLDYYPFDTDFLLQLPVRRILKREGDAAVAALVSIFSTIYSKEGYYVIANEKFCQYVADSLYTLEMEDVKRIVELAVSNELFDERMYREQGILTSREIQRQYLFAKRNRTTDDILPDYLLLEEPAQEAKEETAAEIHINATNKPENAPKSALGTQSIAQHSIAQQSIANPLLQVSPETGGTGEAGGVPPARREVTLQDINALQPPHDGLRRNLDGLKYNLMQLRIPPKEQYAIILKSNYGVIGHPVWPGFGTIRESHGKIRQPGLYLLSLCQKRQGKEGVPKPKGGCTPASS